MTVFCADTPSPPHEGRPETPSELQASQGADDTWYAPHSQRAPAQYAPVQSWEQYEEYVEEYRSKMPHYRQLWQAITRTERCCLPAWPAHSANAGC